MKNLILACGLIFLLASCDSDSHQASGPDSLTDQQVNDFMHEHYGIARHDEHILMSRGYKCYIVPGDNTVNCSKTVVLKD